MPVTRSIALLLALAAGTALADQAPWFAWERSKDADAPRVCAQNSPGPGWEKVAGPFRNAACRP